MFSGMFRLFLYDSRGFAMGLCLGVNVAIAFSLLTGATTTSFQCTNEVSICDRTGYTSFGCYLHCRANGYLIFTGPCSVAKRRRIWDNFLGTVNGTIRRAVEVGLRYYTEGYALRGFLASREVTDKNVKAISQFSCRSEQKVATGYLNLTLGRYKYVLRLGRNKPAASPVWSSYGVEDDNKIFSVLVPTTSYDRLFLRKGCLAMATHFKNGTSGRRAPRKMFGCNGATEVLDENWRSMWLNWSKFEEINKTENVESIMVKDMYGAVTPKRKPPKKKRLGSKLAGMFVICGGGLMFTVMFCGLAIRRRHNIVKDFKNETDSFRIRGI
ncbi:B37 [miniopterid betaherpesvirus 1]|uniref:B37 n=1 Tax=miniopterid betaherpesvirus 1 TaxID=3070189 RepID=I3VQ12_9BETA|nr:B37 [miniopterid betaherpesvirus 1]AFK83856.1 B37 [miniopterid betaherpesvirus 1]